MHIKLCSINLNARDRPQLVFVPWLVDAHWGGIDLYFAHLRIAVILFKFGCWNSLKNISDRCSFEHGLPKFASNFGTM